MTFHEEYENAMDPDFQQTINGALSKHVTDAMFATDPTAADYDLIVAAGKFILSGDNTDMLPFARMLASKGYHKDTTNLDTTLDTLLTNQFSKILYFFA